MENLASLPIAEADRLALEQIEHHREQMSNWRRARARRMAAERVTRSVEEIATALGVTPPTVYAVMRAAK